MDPRNREAQMAMEGCAGKDGVVVRARHSPGVNWLLGKNGYRVSMQSED